MKHFAGRATAFSLVEITVALGIGAFCLIAVFGLLPIGVKTNRDASSQTTATAILCNVIADMRSTPNATTTSTQYQITFGNTRTLYFDGAGHFDTSASPDSRYQLNVTFPSAGGGTFAPIYANLNVRWPANAAATSASGSVEMFVAFDRH
jgi:uncharacterized protein (TIGR02598 family)